MPGNQDSAADDAEGEDILPAEPQAAVEPAPEWLVNFRRSEHKRGFYISGDGYGVVFSDRGSDVLVVSCDNLSSAREDTIDRLPWGYGFVAKNGWSQLGVMTFDADWFRNDGLLTYMQELGQSGFFRRFRKVVMTGTSMGGVCSLRLRLAGAGLHGDGLFAAIDAEKGPGAVGNPLLVRAARGLERTLRRWCGGIRRRRGGVSGL